MVEPSQVLGIPTLVGPCGLGLAIANVVLLGSLSTVWFRSHRRFRTGLTLGFVCFGAVLAVENAVAIYLFLAVGPEADRAMQAMSLLRLLECVALLAITQATVGRSRSRDGVRWFGG